MSELRPSPAFAHLASLRSSARLIFFVIAIDLICAALLFTGLLAGVELAPAEGSPVAAIPPWAWLLAGVTNLAVLVACLRFAWPLLGKGRLPAGLLETSLRRLATMWWVFSAVALLGLLAGVGLLILIAATT